MTILVAVWVATMVVAIGGLLWHFRCVDARERELERQWWIEHDKRRADDAARFKAKMRQQPP